MADAHFEIPRLAKIYDLLEPDRPDLDLYGTIVDELGAARVLDVGCGTGTFACMLAMKGIDQKTGKEVTAPEQPAEQAAS